jgi:leucyl aminopeptidase (aminopeptidase T)
MIDKDRIHQGVVGMFRGNMGLKDGEKILIVTDLPTLEEWQRKRSEELDNALIRSFLAKTVSEIASQEFPQCTVEFSPYPSVGRSGTEPGPEVARKMAEAEVIIAMTTYSLTHTDARVAACKAGARVGSMPGFQVEMFYPGGIMTADYEKIAAQTHLLVEKLTRAEEAVVRSRAGTDLTMSLAGREGLADTGLYRERGDWGNLPGGEAFIAPVEGTGNGKVVVEKDWFRGNEDMVLYFREGQVEELQGGGLFGESLSRTLGLGQAGEPYEARRNLAELGIGTNPKAKSTATTLEAEKIKGTIHIAIGANARMGGKVAADLHLDFVFPWPDLILDGQQIMKEGNLLIQ